MPRHDTFTFRVNEKEREMLENLANHLQRSQSDALRLLVREAVTQLGLDLKQTDFAEGGRHDNS